jgi:hypothetical protein
MTTATSIRKQIADGETTVAEVIYDPEAGHLKVADVIEAQTGWGEARTHKLLEFVGIEGSTRLDDLTWQQRDLLTHEADD